MYSDMFRLLEVIFSLNIKGNVYIYTHEREYIYIYILPFCILPEYDLQEPKHVAVYIYYNAGK